MKLVLASILALAVFLAMVLRAEAANVNENGNDLSTPSRPNPLLHPNLRSRQLLEKFRESSTAPHDVEQPSDSLKQRLRGRLEREPPREAAPMRKTGEFFKRDGTDRIERMVPKKQHPLMANSDDQHHRRLETQ